MSGRKMSSGHSTQYRVRVDEVVALLLDKQSLLEGRKSSTLLKLIMERFSVSKRMAESYLQSALSEVESFNKSKLVDAFGKAMRDREFLFRKAKEKKDLRLALEIVKDRDRIAGLYVENYRINDVTTHEFNDVSFEKLMELLKDE